MKQLSLIRIILLVTIAMAIQCCSTVFERVGEKKSPKLNEYLAMFHEEMDKRGIKNLNYNIVSLRFVDKMPGDKYVAVTYPFGTYKFIDVLRGYYSKAPAEEKEAIVIHEIGHAFGLAHLDEYRSIPYSKFCPVSVMHSSDSMKGCYFKYRSEYLNEMADRIKKLDGRSEYW